MAEQMHGIYIKFDMSLAAIGNKFGFSAAGVKKALDRFGLKTRSRKEAGPIQGRKRSGDLHWARRNPPPIGLATYRSRRVVDEDGLEHKRRVHVILVERKIGRRLQANECVHHIDENRHNNDISNLELMTRSEHGRIHGKERYAKNPIHLALTRDPKTGRYLKKKK